MTVERDAGDTVEDDAGAIVRRAPFASNPMVGARGQKTQERIIQAALEVFGEVGYHACGIEQITKLSGCSRVSFYQYFSSKEDLFRHLAGRVALELAASANEVVAFTPDEAGWNELLNWFDRYSEIYRVYEPVFLAYQAAVTSDEAMATGSARVARRDYASLRGLIEDSPLPDEDVDAVIHTLLDTVSPANRMVALLQQATPGERGWRPHQLNVALADVFHRSLFHPDSYNVHKSRRRSRPRLPRPTPVAAGAGDDAGFGPAATRTRQLILEAAMKVFTERGYYATRVADIVAAADVSHGLFYRYFQSKTDIFQLISDHAVEQLGGAFDNLPMLANATGENRDQLLGWMGDFAGRFSEEASLIAMWIEAMSRGRELAPASVVAIERGRVALSNALQSRDFGDADAEAIVLLVFLFVMAARRRSDRVDGFARMIERGLLTPPPPGTEPAKAAPPRPKKRAAKTASKR